MPPQPDYSMLKLDSRAFNIALAKAEMDLKELAEKAGVSYAVVRTARRGFYVKPHYIGKIARALNVEVESILAKEETTYEEYYKKTMGNTLPGI